MLLLAQVELTAASGIARDSVINTFSITTAGDFAPATDLLELSSPIADFYNYVTPGSGRTVASYMSTSISRAAQACRIKYYDVGNHLTGTNYGSPIRTDAFTLAAADNSGSNLPNEMAAVLTLRATGWEGQAVEAPDTGDPGAEVDRPRQRRTGRIYVGPLRSDTGSTGTFGLHNLTNVFRTTVLESAANLCADLAVNNHRLSVWSRVGPSFLPVTHVQMDNAYDVQRRRGQDATTRVTVAV